MNKRLCLLETQWSSLTDHKCNPRVTVIGKNILSDLSRRPSWANISGWCSFMMLTCTNISSISKWDFLLASNCMTSPYSTFVFRSFHRIKFLRLDYRCIILQILLIFESIDTSLLRRLDIGALKTFKNLGQGAHVNL